MMNTVSFTPTFGGRLIDLSMTDDIAVAAKFEPNDSEKLTLQTILKTPVDDRHVILNVMRTRPEGFEFASATLSQGDTTVEIDQQTGLTALDMATGSIENKARVLTILQFAFNQFLERVLGKNS